MNNHPENERIGRIYRHKTEYRKRLSFIDAELSDASQLFKKAAAQLECLIAQERSEVEPVLAKVNVDRILKLLAERAQICERLSEANEQLRRLGVQV